MKSGIRTILPLITACALSACAPLPFGEPDPVLVSSTYLCDEGRTFTASFDPQGRKASLLVNGTTMILYRRDSADATAVFTGRGMKLNVSNDEPPVVWLEQNGIVHYRRCVQERKEG